MYTILGATGKTGGKIADILIKRGEQVRLVARSADRLRPLVRVNAQAFVGDVGDTEFLVKAFKGVDAVYTLLPPNFKAEKFLDYADRIIESVARAIEISGVKYVVNLSSVGAELPTDTGPIAGLHRMEERLNRVKGLNVLHVRAAYFMENLLMSKDLILAKGINGSALHGDKKIPMIATRDIAAVVADRLVKRDFSGAGILPLNGQRDLSMNEATSIIAKKIAKPDLTYVTFTYDEAEKGFQAAGISHDMSRLYAEMGRAFNEGRILPQQRTGLNSTPTSFERFCDEVLVPAYTEKKAA